MLMIVNRYSRSMCQKFKNKDLLIDVTSQPNAVMLD